jgi:hypothetical protein
MLRSIEDLKGCKVSCPDGELGAVAHVYFDDEMWGIRFIVIEAMGWNNWQEVWVSPLSVRGIDFAVGVVTLNLTQRQMTGSPPIDTRNAISRLQETKLFDYYGCRPYWAARPTSTYASHPAGSNDSRPGLESLQLRPTLHVKGSRADIHLLSAQQAGSFSVATADGVIGHVTDFVFDDETWVVRYMTVDTRDWWDSAREILLSTEWIESVDSVRFTVSTTLTRDAVEHSPAYVDAVPLNRMYETQLHNFYGREAYWS